MPHGGWVFGSASSFSSLAQSGAGKPSSAGSCGKQGTIASSKSSGASSRKAFPA